MFQSHNPNPDSTSVKKFFIDIFETFVSSIVVITVIYSTVAFPELVVGSSMEPNFYTGERILVEKLSKHFVPIHRGDVVVLHPPGDDKTDFVKRVVGIPGDVVKLVDCRVYIKDGADSYMYVEDYLRDGTCTRGGGKVRDGRSIVIDKDSYLVLGDNREKSLDSRTFGLVKQDRIIGRVVYKFWPPTQMGFVD
ncbi:TPA: signal peptidase I [candidate division WWE3 bacterium]|uniref:Signal peptidase I n=3 Tax=Katanobacteria TaxID=422282 RepID=A0A0G1KH64_UNCKA|nr:MAG: Signal peptidase I [candidate division WWE3 bacterium GW2011_GWA2_44_16]KKT82893.1 MAG: Signal peptidase I [candidate division WWE3 bacterium GW2011_GWC2_44_9]HAZ29326.1 signal peptidase I [candidate division WWE3 bacterium]